MCCSLSLCISFSVCVRTLCMRWTVHMFTITDRFRSCYLDRFHHRNSLHRDCVSPIVVSRDVYVVLLCPHRPPENSIKKKLIYKFHSDLLVKYWFLDGCFVLPPISANRQPVTHSLNFFQSLQEFVHFRRAMDVVANEFVKSSVHPWWNVAHVPQSIRAAIAWPVLGTCTRMDNRSNSRMLRRINRRIWQPVGHFISCIIIHFPFNQSIINVELWMLTWLEKNVCRDPERNSEPIIP